MQYFEPVGACWLNTCFFIDWQLLNHTHSLDSASRSSSQINYIFCEAYNYHNCPTKRQHQRITSSDHHHRVLKTQPDSFTVGELKDPDGQRGKWITVRCVCAGVWVNVGACGHVNGKSNTVWMSYFRIPAATILNLSWSFLRNGVLQQLTWTKREWNSDSSNPNLEI